MLIGTFSCYMTDELVATMVAVDIDHMKKMVERRVAAHMAEPRVMVASARIVHIHGASLHTMTGVWTDAGIVWGEWDVPPEDWYKLPRSDHAAS